MTSPFNTSNVLRPSKSSHHRSATPSGSVKREPVERPSAPASRSQTPSVHYTDYRLRSCSEEELQGVHHHIMKFHSRQTVDPIGGFQHPISMQRKDPRSLRYHQDGADGDVAMDDEDSKDRIKDELDMADHSKIAPDSVANPNNNPARVRKRFQKKTRQVYTGHEEERKLRYEENYPWILEDFEGKNTWVSNYEAAQSDSYVLFVFDEDGFKMVPAEKWYKFTQRNKYATLSLEEAEATLAQKNKVPRWLMKHINPDVGDTTLPPPKKRLRTVDGDRRPVKKEEDDGDELDFDEEFADDEEAPIMEGPEEENREVEQRMKRQMRTNNVADEANEVALEEENDDDRKIGKEGRKLKKYLTSLENNAVYDSDNEENPYASDDDDDNSVFGEERTGSPEKAKDEVKRETA
ncbi:uncharacterized protein V1510DRAFT_291741 [Dipodascopsis tothii]|uniref:uncharacterized protein n=1 Tax=Dipodascopsis tothii TaxID=44089 RepID=UPI0034CE9EA3